MHKLLTFTGRMSFFGGPNDPEDSGNTSSGFSTKDHPDTFYVALPWWRRKLHRIRWYSRVTIENLKTHEQARGFLADNGPSIWTGRKVDLSPMFNKQLGIDTDTVVRVYIDRDRIITNPLGENGHGY